MKQKFYTFLLIGISWLGNANAQTTINVAGNSANINGMTFDYSIGEMTSITTERSNNLIVTQGLLQPAGSQTPASELPGGGFDHLQQLVKVYPNPTQNFLFIESENPFGADFNYQLIDASGKTVLARNSGTEINPSKWNLNLSALAMGSYFLMVQQKDEAGKMQNLSFKIQKTN